ncbi:Sugar transporter STL1 [Fusarium oxysporum f. sp. rapae]|uniref:Sugar transporter STL1 n=1 Tax=Fusarium oxysporum f. sp. rapae TaxID=485398 RepID=A0A8J5PKQ7_FUSOX|nr:Sugar transporter STL1 [Fusarium oxysporum f. sp. rapae]
MSPLSTLSPHFSSSSSSQHNLPESTIQEKDGFLWASREQTPDGPDLGRHFAVLSLLTVSASIYRFGYNNSIAGGFLSLPSWVETFPVLDTVHTKGATKNHNSTLQVGRKKTIIFGAAINTIGAALQASSYSLPQLVVGRLVSGYGFGHITATAPNWQAECSGAAHRGAAVMLEGLFISLDLAIGGWTNLGMSFHHGSVTFRFPMAISGVFSVIIILTTPLLPESPRWLTKKGRVDRAREVLADLTETDANSVEVREAIREIETSLALAGEAKLKDIFTNGPLRLFHRMCLACAAQCFQQMSGINALAFYQAKIFEDYLKQTPRAAKIIAASVFTWQTICSPIGVLTVDRFGRRKLMMVSSLGMGVCMAVVAGGSSQPGNATSVGVAAAFIFLFSLFFPTGFLGLTFLYAAEISPLSHRVPITAISTAIAWLFNFVVAEITPIGLATLKYRYYIIYAAINICLTFPSLYFLFPETSGLHLEEVDAIFLDSRNILETVSIARRSQPVHQRSNIDKGRGEKQEVAQIEKGMPAP